MSPENRPDPPSDSALLFDADPLEVLEDFAMIQGMGWQAILPANTPQSVLADVSAAFVANRLGITHSYARKAYVHDVVAPVVSELEAVSRDLYFAGKHHVSETQSRFRAGPEPGAGEVIAEATLVRLQSTYFAAGLLYRTGNWFEAHAVARTFIEQVAWAYAIRGATTAQETSAMAPTRAIGSLKTILPWVGRLYGFLSERTHLALDAHAQFVELAGTGSRVIVRDSRRSLSESRVLLRLADAWSVVYEFTQARFMASLENWSGDTDGLLLRADRPFQLRAGELEERLKRSLGGA